MNVPATPDWPRPWERDFDELLRAVLNLTADDPVLEPNVNLRQLGLDSLGTVRLFLELERRYAIRFPDEYLVPNTYASPSTLWAAVSALRRATAGTFEIS